jgi:hypothetical protein
MSFAVRQDYRWTLAALVAAIALGIWPLVRLVLWILAS